MVRAWYLVQVWLLNSLRGGVMESVIGTRPTHAFMWDVAEVVGPDGTVVSEVPQRPRRKYGLSMGIVYDREFVDGDMTTMPQFAVVQVDAPAEEDQLEPVDYMLRLDTATNEELGQFELDHPSLVARFEGQPAFAPVDNGE